MNKKVAEDIGTEAASVADQHEFAYHVVPPDKEMGRPVHEIGSPHFGTVDDAVEAIPKGGPWGDNRTIITIVDASKASRPLVAVVLFTEKGKPVVTKL